MNLLSLFLPWRLQPAAQRLLRPDEAALAAPEGADASDGEGEDRPRGCGWFDSSHDLQHGLSVREHASPDTLARELPLANWLDLHLSGWHASGPVANRT